MYNEFRFCKWNESVLLMLQGYPAPNSNYVILSIINSSER